ELEDFNKPKVVLNTKKEAIYFSRYPIPYLRGIEQSEWLNHVEYFNHIGIYGFQIDILKELTQLPISTLEKAESLEQLRWIENGYKIQTALSNHLNDSIDTPEDLQHILKKYFS